MLQWCILSLRSSILVPSSISTANMDRKTVLVTGANTGLGYQIIRSLCASEKPYDILLAGRSLAKAKKATDDVVQEFPSTHSHISAIQVDIEDDDSIHAAVQAVQNLFGKLDFLINNAGTPLTNLHGLGWISLLIPSYRRTV
jgi:NAD(P)-dependent dehydrogenase (short-subunit alcohol dehydrogenase family)